VLFVGRLSFLSILFSPISVNKDVCIAPNAKCQRVIVLALWLVDTVGALKLLVDLVQFTSVIFKWVK